MEMENQGAASGSSRAEDRRLLRRRPQASRRRLAALSGADVMSSSGSVSTFSSSSDRPEHAESQLSRPPGSAEDGLDVAVPTAQADSYPEDPDLTVETGELDLLNRVTSGSLGTTRLEVAGETKEKEKMQEESEIWEVTTEELVKMLSAMQDAVLRRNEEKREEHEEALEGLTKTHEAIVAELIRRNVEKSKKIMELSSRINLLTNENVELKNHLSSREVGEEQKAEPRESRLSKSTGFILKKFSGCAGSLATQS